MSGIVVWNPTITDAGSAAALNANATGFKLEITAVAFGTGAYNPSGLETALQNEVKRVPIFAGEFVTEDQARIIAMWESATDNYAIHEIGFFAGDTLFAVWSKVSSEPIGYKSPGVDFVLYNDIRLVGVPTGSLSIQTSSDDYTIASQMLLDHMSDPDPHPGAAYAAEDHTHSLATTTTAGFMSAADKLALDAIAGGGSGSGGQYLGNAAVKAIAFNAQVIDESLTIAAGTNGLSAGPITVANGRTVTVSNGSNWVIA